ncbi:MAG: AAA domain-containing protein [Bacteroidia bacterium]|nr:AAA domain-containing protein [Bacteroidia bacterium]
MEDKLINNKKFLEILREKLSRGNKKSIHLNALPGRSATRIDFLDIDLIEKAFSKSFLNKLFTKKTFKIDISFEDDFDLNEIDEKTAKKLTVSIRRLKSICKQNNDFFQEHGLKPFGFGYPIIYKRDSKDPKNIIKAPLIIWALEIEEDRKHINKWTIKREEDFPIYFNDVLISHIEKDEGVKLSKIRKELLEDFILDNNEINEIISDFLNQFGSKLGISEIQNSLNNFQRCDSFSDQEDLINRIPKIVNAGVLGLFINQKQSIIEDYNLVIERDTNIEESNLINENFKINPFPAIDTDPSQQSVLNCLSEKNKIIIHGPPGTGKSQSLTAIITNALANHAKCLVVCEKRTALEVISKNLNNLGVEKLIALIEDTSKDRRIIVDTARETIDDINKTMYRYKDYKFNEPEFVKLINDTKEIRNEILKFHSSLNEQIFNIDNWTNLVGRFLHSSKNLNTADFDKRINKDIFSLDYQEYSELTKSILKLSYFFDKYNPSKSALEFVVYETVKELDITSVTDYLKDTLIDNLKNLQNISEIAAKLLSGYENELSVDCTNHYKNIKNKIQSLTNIYTKHNAKWLFERNFWPSNSLLSMLSFFSSPHKEILSDKRAYIQLFRDLKNEIITYQYLVPPNLSDNNPERLVTIFNNIQSFEETADSWFASLNTFIAEKVSNFEINCTQKFERVAITQKEFQIAYNNLLTNHKTKNIFNFRYLIAPATVISIVETLNLVLKKLAEIQSELDSIHDFIEWKAFYTSLDAKTIAVVDAIIQTDIKIGEPLFDSWYFNKVLNKYNSQKISGVESLLENISKNTDTLKIQTIKKILAYWQTKRIESIYRFNNANLINAKQLFSKRNSAGRKQTLRQIIFQDFELFTDIFPVVMVNPSVCSSIFPLKENLFDIVIFDEASQLRIEDTFCALIRGKIKIISGDEHQMPPSSYFQSNEFYIDSESDEDNEITEEQTKRQFDDAIVNLAYQESLLDYASELNYLDADLQIHYRSRHPLLIDFSNAAFYGKKLNPLPEMIDYKPIRFIQVNGIYYNQVNEIEAKQVINILKTNILKDEHGNYPSIGIATFNLHQRNLIIDEINREANADQAFSAKIDSFYENGMFIKNLENIQGDERDIIIISTTFGKNKDGYFSEKFGPLNVGIKGHRLLNVIITRAKYKIYVCSSFPEEKIAGYKEYIQNLGNIGRGILYAYLAYAKAIETSNWESVEYILSLLAEKSSLRVKSGEPIIGTESPFEQEVVDYLIGSGFPANRVVLQYKCGGFRIDIAIISKFREKPIIAIECDGAAYHSSSEAYLWDTFRQKQLENYGLKFIRVWSTNWWVNPKRELSKILKFISDIDSNDSESSVKSIKNKNLLDSIVIPVYISLNEVKLNSKVKISNLKTSKEFTIKIVDEQQLKIRHDGIQPVFIRAPLALAMMGKTEGNNFQIELSGEIFNILEILN